MSDIFEVMSRSEIMSCLMDIAINLITFGCAGDGITDDSTLIQNAINSGSPILIPKGKTFLCSNLNLTTSSFIFGYGTLKQKDSNPIFNGNGISEFQLKGFNVTGVNKDTNVIKVTNSTKFRIRGLKGVGSIDVDQTCDTFTINKNNLNGSIVIDGNSKNVKVLDNEVYGSSNNGIAFFTQIEKALIRGNHCYNHALNGIQLHSIINSSCIQNICESNTQSGFGINNAQTTNKPTDLVVSNNVSMLNGYDGFDIYNGDALSNLRLTLTGNESMQNSGTGMFLSYASLVNATGNTCKLNGKQGILLNQSSYNTLTGNVCLGNGNNNPNTMAGIALQDSSRNTVTGNLSTNQGAPANQSYGIQELGTSDYNLITGNSTFNNATNELIQKLGVNTKLGTNQPG